MSMPLVLSTNQMMTLFYLNRDHIQREDMEARIIISAMTNELNIGTHIELKLKKLPDMVVFEWVLLNIAWQLLTAVCQGFLQQKPRFLSNVTSAT